MPLILTTQHEALARPGFLLNVLFPLLILSAIYSAVIFGLVLLLRRLGVAKRRAIFLGFLSFGLLSGTLTASLWPVEASMYFNVFAALLGDRIYVLAIQHLGDASSPQAHFTIPWILRIPQVYALASLALSALAGLLFQWIPVRDWPPG